MVYELTDKDKSALRRMSNSDIETISELMPRMAKHPFQVTDKPGRLAALGKEAAMILRERGL